MRGRHQPRVRWCRRERRRKGPRDEYLRPMVDVTGIKYRLGLDTADTEARIREEFEENQLDSRAAVRFAGGWFGELPACSLVPISLVCWCDGLGCGRAQACWSWCRC